MSHHTLFDITKNDIEALDNATLRELIARLCVAEAHRLGYRSSVVTSGGEETATDGGLDVVIDLRDVGAPVPTSVSEANAQHDPKKSFLPRRLTGIQVKKNDLAREAVKKEMLSGKPVGLRPSLQQLADQYGAYLLTSGAADCSATMLTERLEGMAEAVVDYKNGHQLALDFLDQDRIAKWAREYKGVVQWIKEKRGNALRGWRPFESWSTPGSTAATAYIPDDAKRIQFDTAPGRLFTVIEAIDQLRRSLAEPKSIVRIVGLSGVGKTRFIEALFDPSIGTVCELSQATVLYTENNVAVPSPMDLLSYIEQLDDRVTLVIDNCAPELHGKLAAQVKNSKNVSLITVEYDVRDDFPEHTDVVKIAAASDHVIHELVHERYQHLTLNAVDVITRVSGGNARIALAIARSVKATDSLAGIPEEAVFDRIFSQGRGNDKDLKAAAQACALVYSFDGNSLEEPGSELAILAKVARMSPEDLYAHIAELQSRDLIQQRSQWRALLPQALAAKLASAGLAKTHFDTIQKLLIGSGNVRLIRSFTRRLSDLHDSEHARILCTTWLANGNILADVGALDADHSAMLENIAPVVPTEVLAALASVSEHQQEEVWGRHAHLIWKLAYDQALFPKAVFMLERLVRQDLSESDGPAFKALASFFQPHLSGTMAAPIDRFKYLYTWAQADNAKLKRLAVAALDKATDSSSKTFGDFSFGSRPRSRGCEIEFPREYDQWMLLILPGIQILLRGSKQDQRDAKSLICKCMEQASHLDRALDQLLDLISEAHGGAFWNQAWGIFLTLENRTKLRSAAFEAFIGRLRPLLEPGRISDQVWSRIALGGAGGKMHRPNESWEDGLARIGEEVTQFAREAVSSEDDLRRIATMFMRTMYYVNEFAAGLAESTDRRTQIWACLSTAFRGKGHVELISTGLLHAYLFAMGSDRAFVAACLDDCVNDPELNWCVFSLQVATGIDALGASRLNKVHQARRVPLIHYAALAGIDSTNLAQVKIACSILVEIASNPKGFEVAMRCLSLWFNRRPAQIDVQQELNEAARRILAQFVFTEQMGDIPVLMCAVIEGGLAGHNGATVARQLASTLVDLVEKDRMYSLRFLDTVGSLASVQPGTLLSALFPDQGGHEASSISLITGAHFSGRRSPITKIRLADLVGWCDEMPEKRYDVAARMVPVFAPRSAPDDVDEFSEQVIALLKASSAPMRFLNGLSARLRQADTEISTWQASEIERFIGALGAASRSAHEPLLAGMEALRSSCQKELDANRKTLGAVLLPGISSFE